MTAPEQIIAPTMSTEIDPICALLIAEQGISGDEIAMNPAIAEDYTLYPDRVAARCGACALLVSIPTKGDSSTIINQQPCLYK